MVAAPRAQLTGARHVPEQACACADLAQGVNAALVDVGVLSQCFERNPQDLGAALKQYEEQRLPENAALIRLVQVRQRACLSASPAASAPS